MLDALEVTRLLEVAREASREAPLVDVHTHPFEIFTGERGYGKQVANGGLVSRIPFSYISPSASEFNELSAVSIPISHGGSLLQARLSYGHTGPRVFHDHMALCGIGRSLLLPVARSPKDAEAQLAELAELFGGNADLPFAAPLPPGLAPVSIPEFLHAARERYGVVAVKIHPNFSGIDLGTPGGCAYVEAALAAAGALGLPTVIHGGASPGVIPMSQAAFAGLANLAQVNWSAARAPVVIAHGGLFGLTPLEIEEKALPLLQMMLERWNHLLVDTSGLARHPLGLMLDHIPRERILFGSDSLYYPPWRGVVLLLALLRERTTNYQREFLHLASSNTKAFFNG